jgi:hypothetical protein
LNYASRGVAGHLRGIGGQHKKDYEWRLQVKSGVVSSGKAIKFLATISQFLSRHRGRLTYPVDMSPNHPIAPLAPTLLAEELQWIDGK